MPRTARRILAPLALLACLGLPACSYVTGKDIQTEMIVANHTSSTITVSYAQHADNGQPTSMGILDQQVLPDGTIRYSGTEGDSVIVRAPNEPPLTLVFARRSQVVKVSESADGVSLNVKQGYTDPNRR